LRSLSWPVTYKRTVPNSYMASKVNNHPFQERGREKPKGTQFIVQAEDGGLSRVSSADDIAESYPGDQTFRVTQVADAPGGTQTDTYGPTTATC
jgi:hypothetical protein